MAERAFSKHVSPEERWSGPQHAYRVQRDTLRIDAYAGANSAGTAFRAPPPRPERHHRYSPSTRNLPSNW